MRGDLPVKLEPGAEAKKDAVSQRVETAAYTVETLGKDAGAGPSTECGGAQDTESDDTDNDGEDQVSVELSVLPAMPRKKKSSAKLNQNEILLTLWGSVCELETQVKEMEAERDVGQIATLSQRSGQEEKGETR